MLRSLILSAVMALVLCGCATIPRDEVADDGPRDGLTCAALDAHAINADQLISRRNAEAALMSRLKDMRGDMLTARYRKLRYELHPTQCEIIGGPFGGIHCKAVGSVCGR